jgi:hypothetical protein
MRTLGAARGEGGQLAATGAAAGSPEGILLSEFNPKRDLSVRSLKLN